MDSYAFTMNLIKTDRILDYESFTEAALKAVLADELSQKKFMSVIQEFKSFEGNNHKFCVNFTGAWLKYALNGEHDKDKMKSHKLVERILGDEFHEMERGGGTSPPQISDEQYKNINWIEFESDEDHSSQRKYILKKCKKLQVSNNSYQPINIILMRPKDFIDVITSSRCVSEYRKYFITLAEIRRSYQESYVPWILSNQNNLIKQKDCKIDDLRDEIRKQSEEMKKQSEESKAQIQELLSYAKETKSELSEARLDIQDGIIKIEDLTDTVDELNDKVEECREVITERLEDHTINPKSITKRQYFACLESPEYGNVLYVIRSQKSNIRKQLKDHSDWDVLIEPIEDPNSIKMFNRFKDRVYKITKDWKSELRLQKRNNEITHDEYDNKIAYMRRHPLIYIRRNSVEFDDSRISTEEIIKLMKDTTFERFSLRIP